MPPRDKSCIHGMNTEIDLDRSTCRKLVRFILKESGGRGGLGVVSVKGAMKLVAGTTIVVVAAKSQWCTWEFVRLFFGQFSPPRTTSPSGRYGAGEFPVSLCVELGYRR